ncbi:putative BEST plant protein match is: (TAIR:plant.1) protein [Quillaja saponaria]|uniref:BEST plant protein match is: (TAIR:plant.1) protein n=1 Tax=Quillaja saponaria TaxID=32244 RepID=A0AAD7PTA5_QUISA|nr:putative BEST plant protein match is: (TAIR:plant.1) protein [Quillaja saponaria]
MDPRISFSNDFVDTQHAIKHENTYREAPVSSDFEFSARNYNMTPADEVFFKGMLLPIKNKTTLRDELLVGDDYEDVPQSVPKSSSRWKERFSFSRAVSKKDKSGGGTLHRIVEEKRPSFVHEDAPIRKEKLEFIFEGSLN